jgi:hypothetical protein
MSGRWYLNCDSCLIYERVRTGNPIVRTGVSIFPYSELGKNLKLIDHWEESEQMQAGTEAFWYSIGPDGNIPCPGGWCLVCRASGQYGTSSGRMEQWTDGRLDGIARSSRRLTRNLNSSNFQAVQSLLRVLWIVESLFTSSLHTCDFVQTEWDQ